MSLYKEWLQISENHENQQAEVKFWEEYLKVEASIYNKILIEKTKVVEGKLSDLAVKYDTNNEFFMGFLDGINESIVEELNLEEITSDSDIKIEIDWEKLYYNMVAVEAHWLYNLTAWDGVLSFDKRKEIQKAYKTSKTIVKATKVGRNEPCPCGSGKKYKKCCGK